jgi:deoxyribose-phosphate aldolase
MTLEKLIDHTNLKADATENEIEELCREAQLMGANSICVRPRWIKKFSKFYKCSAVIGFPEEVIFCDSPEDLKTAKNTIGNLPLEIKLNEMKKALEDGALELDPVIKLIPDGLGTEALSCEAFERFLKNELEQYLKTIGDFVKHNPRLASIWLKPIFSCELLSDEELDITVKVLSSLLNYPDYSERIKLAYKNSTGFVKSTKSDLQILLANSSLINKITKLLDKYDLEKNIYIKAAGGIRDWYTAQKIYEAAEGRLSHIGSSSLKSL